MANVRSTGNAGTFDDQAALYDELTGPSLRDDLWQCLTHPVADPQSVCMEPAAVTKVSDGQVTVTVNEFTRFHDRNQGMDNTKHVIFSKREFLLPADRPARFSVEMRVENIGGDPSDYQGGAAAFNVVDLDGVSRLVFDLIATSRRVFAVEEQLPGSPGGRQFTRVVEDPFLGVQTDFSEFHTYEVVLDRDGRQAGWWVDGRKLHEVRGLEVLPASVHVGFGFFTLSPLTAGGSRSVRGQGMSATWRRFRYQV